MRISQVVVLGFLLVLLLMPAIALHQTRYVYGAGSSAVSIPVRAWGNDYYTSRAYYFHPTYESPVIGRGPYNYVWFRDDMSSYSWQQ